MFLRIYLLIGSQWDRLKDIKNAKVGVAHSLSHEKLIKNKTSQLKEERLGLFLFTLVEVMRTEKGSRIYGIYRGKVILCKFCGQLSLIKVAFFQKVRFVIHISKSPKKIFQKSILDLKFKFPTNFSILLLAGNLNFKFRVVFWNIFILEIGRFEKHIALSEKRHLQKRGVTIFFC